MKIIKVTILNDENQEQELKVMDGSVLLACEDNKILTQVTTNAAINIELLKNLLNK
jgi:predicted ATP-grasp superfamily ATP-dependent carboligase